MDRDTFKALVKVMNKSKKLTLLEVRTAIAFDQPELRATLKGRNIHIQGSYKLFENGAVSNPAGPITSFDVLMIFASDFPHQEPKVFEIGGRIPRCADRHINLGGDCCVTVWEHWLTSSGDVSFAMFLNGPIHEYFLSQYWYERTGKWPFGEREHGLRGLEEAYAEALGITNRKKDVLYHLKLLSNDWPKGHWLCPCGSGKLLRYCHRGEMMALHDRIPPRIARRMFQRLKSLSKNDPMRFARSI